MGIFIPGKPGVLKGKIGPVVTTNWKNIQVVKSRPPGKRKKSTEAQLRQMAKMKLMVPFVRPLTDMLNRVYGATILQMSCFNKAISLNMKNAIQGEYPDFKINHARFMLGVGDLLNPENIIMEAGEPGTLRIRWTDNSGEGTARPTDQAFAAVYADSQQKWKIFEHCAARNAGGCRLELSVFSGQTVYVYIGFVSANARIVSNSFYAGFMTVK